MDYNQVEIQAQEETLLKEDNHNNKEEMDKNQDPQLLDQVYHTPLKLNPL